MRTEHKKREAVWLPVIWSVCAAWPQHANLSRLRAAGAHARTLSYLVAAYRSETAFQSITLKNASM